MLWPDGTKTKPYVSSPFGPRKAPIPGASTNHRGADFSHTFELIRVVAPGRVVAIDVWPALGYSVWIQHDGFFSKSGHMKSRTPLRIGEDVAEGRIAGVMGKTGTATDTHLHFEITPGVFHTANRGQVDPVAFIRDHLAVVSGGTTAPAQEEFLMGLSQYDQEETRNAVVATNNRTHDMSIAIEELGKKIGALHTIYAERDANGWTWADIVKSHVVATLAELRGAGIATGSVDVDALAARIVDETARRLTTTN